MFGRATLFSKTSLLGAEKIVVLDKPGQSVCDESLEQFT
jgi:hypothetical protein